MKTDRLPFHFSAPRDDIPRAGCGDGAKANSFRCIIRLSEAVPHRDFGEMAAFATTLQIIALFERICAVIGVQPLRQLRCKGVYLYPVRDYLSGNLLFHAAARLRSAEFNYISLETVLSDAGVIPQVPINWISLMSSGRSHVVDCGDFGHIEFVHTTQKPEEISAELAYDPDRHLWKASVKQALRDMRATRRSIELVDEEALDELV